MHQNHQKYEEDNTIEKSISHINESKHYILCNLTQTKQYIYNILTKQTIYNL
jgi:hypothetical protein